MEDKETRQPDFKLAWEIVTPEPLPEPLPLFLVPTYQCLIDAFGPFTVRRWDPLPHMLKVETTFYQVQFAETLAFRKDGTWNGSGSISFYGIGGFGYGIDHVVVSAFESVGYFRGCIAVKPPHAIYGLVIARARSIRQAVRRD